jgi:hypothetical protein
MWILDFINSVFVEVSITCAFTVLVISIRYTYSNWVVHNSKITKQSFFAHFCAISRYWVASMNFKEHKNVCHVFRCNDQAYFDHTMLPGCLTVERHRYPSTHSTQLSSWSVMPLHKHAVMNVKRYCNKLFLAWCSEVLVRWGLSALIIIRYNIMLQYIIAN